MIWGTARLFRLQCAPRKPEESVAGARLKPEPEEPPRLVKVPLTLLHKAAGGG
jgi:hypothetical protein